MNVGKGSKVAVLVAILVFVGVMVIGLSALYFDCK